MTVYLEIKRISRSVPNAFPVPFNIYYLEENMLQLEFSFCIRRAQFCDTFFIKLAVEYFVKLLVFHHAV
jgi:hypothetical protein